MTTIVHWTELVSNFCTFSLLLKTFAMWCLILLLYGTVLWCVIFLFDGIKQFRPSLSFSYTFHHVLTSQEFVLTQKRFFQSIMIYSIGYWFHNPRSQYTPFVVLGCKRTLLTPVWLVSLRLLHLELPLQKDEK